MISNKDLILLLKELGLTEYEAKAYITLVSSGPLKVTDIAEISGVPMSRTYDVLRKLEQRGFLEVQLGRPRVFYPVPPEQAFELIKKRIAKTSGELTRALKPLSETALKRQDKTIWTLRGARNIMRKLDGALDQIREEFLFATIATPAIITSSDYIVDRAKKLVKSCSNVKILVGGDSNYVSQFRKLGQSVNDINIKSNEDIAMIFVVWDKREAILTVSLDEYTTLENVLGIWIRDTGVAEMLTILFHKLWDESDII